MRVKDSQDSQDSQDGLGSGRSQTAGEEGRSQLESQLGGTRQPQQVTETLKEVQSL